MTCIQFWREVSVEQPNYAAQYDHKGNATQTINAIGKRGEV